MPAITKAPCRNRSCWWWIKPRAMLPSVAAWRIDELRADAGCRAGGKSRPHSRREVPSRCVHAQEAGHSISVRWRRSAHSRNRIRLPCGATHRAGGCRLCRDIPGGVRSVCTEATRIFGMPFYTGWGLTQDELPAPRGARPLRSNNSCMPRSCAYPRYIDPETGEPCEVERVLDYLAFQRQMRARFPAEIHARGFSLLKRRVLRTISRGSTCISRRTAPRAAHLALWGRAQPKQRPEGRIIRIEDGFLRSVGLGADLVQPVSWVLDEEGIYYDASAPSALERTCRKRISIRCWSNARGVCANESWARISPSTTRQRRDGRGQLP